VEGENLVVQEARHDASLAPGGAGQRVLVVEDNIDVGRFSTQILQDLGYRTTWAANAEDALEMLGNTGADFDVVFSDVVMPGMGGIELAKALRKRFPNLAIALTSGYSNDLAEQGAHGFELLHKPYSAEQLSLVLQRVARNARRGIPAA
jgi:CheY-like chemotaxis protein